MKDTFIESITPDSGTVELFAQATDVSKRDTKTGKPYLSLKLRDRTGECAANVWDIPPDFACAAGDFLKVKAACSTYKDALQLKVLLIRQARPDEIAIEDFIPASKRSRTEMYTELMVYVLDCISDKPLSSAVAKLLQDHYGMILNAPAAQKMHQAYLGGLLEHVLNLCQLVQGVCGVYPDLNRDVLLAGAILHDIGKLFELSYETSIGRTREGALVGHIVQGSVLWQKYATGVDLAIRDHVAHIIVSHHGVKEWGSPVLPATREAQVFHLLDMIDSRMAICTEALDGPVDADGFTSKVYALETQVWNGK